MESQPILWKKDLIHQIVTSVFCPGSQRNKVSLCQVEIALVSVSVCEAGGLKSVYFVWKAQTACCRAEEQAGGSLLINYYWKAHSHHLRCEIMPSAFLGLWFTLWQLSVPELPHLREVKLALKTNTTTAFLLQRFNVFLKTSEYAGDVTSLSVACFQDKL